MNKKYEAPAVEINVLESDDIILISVNRADAGAFEEIDWDTVSE